MDKHKISVVMSTYREEERHLREAIESVLNQTWKEIEFIIIIDDPDNLKLHEILHKYEGQDNRIKVLKNKKNLGSTLSRNRGIDMATGEFLAIMDADDICFANRLEEQLNYILNNSDVSVVTSERYEIDENGDITSTTVRTIDNDQIPNILRYSDILTNPTAFMKMSAIRELGGYREVVCAEDYDLWLRCCTKKLKIHNINRALLKYRIRQDSLSHANFARTYAGAKYAKVLYRERIKKGKDSFSKDNYSEYLKNSVIATPERAERFNNAYRKYLVGVGKLKERKLLSGGILLIRCFLEDIELLALFFNDLKSTFYLHNAMKRNDK